MANWIAGAIKKKGALTASAHRAGAMTKRGTISREWLEEEAKKGGTAGRRARLAKTLGKLRRKQGQGRGGGILTKIFGR